MCMHMFIGAVCGAGVLTHVLFIYLLCVCTIEIKHLIKRSFLYPNTLCAVGVLVGKVYRIKVCILYIVCCTNFHLPFILSLICNHHIANEKHRQYQLYMRLFVVICLLILLIYTRKCSRSRHEQHVFVTRSIYIYIQMSTRTSTSNGVCALSKQCNSNIVKCIYLSLSLYTRRIQK